MSGGPSATDGCGRLDSLWWAQLDAGDLARSRPPVAGDREFDIVIVGGGFTGLWSAYYLLQHDPHLRVAIVEQSVVAAGASGRNGGWCSSLLPIDWDTVGKRYGRDATIAWQRAADQTLVEIESVVAERGIDCSYAKGGYLQTASDPVQLERLREALANAREWGRDDTDLHMLSAAESRDVIAAPLAVGALYNPHCAAVQPAKLARGLAVVVESMGAVIYENSLVHRIEPSRVRTEHGTLRTDVVLRATEGYTPALAGARRELLPFYSSMIATEVLDEALWDEIGWRRRETFNDASRNMFYAQRTADGRIAFGGRGARQRFAGRLVDPLPELDRVQELLRHRLVSQLPQLADVEVTHRWAGVLGITRDWMPSVRFDRRSGIAIVGGYSGDGVALANLAGRTVTDLIAGKASPLVRLPWVDHRSRRWEPEPLRSLGVLAGESLARSADHVEQRSAKQSKLLGGLAQQLLGG